MFYLTVRLLRFEKQSVVQKNKLLLQHLCSCNLFLRIKAQD